ncbi:hypothetical protein JKP88DRAFT_277604 [Tribonema minus]|uniref:Rieske domain-containing protein n=1 Tax=Tribonema minus TaxID=303371 RepID=A0A836CFS0_9STRA|nr:hypothetical protein JKP88DRAFT_277604 [Tribonema minus]
MFDDEQRQQQKAGENLLTPPSIIPQASPSPDGTAPQYQWLDVAAIPPSTDADTAELQPATLRSSGEAWVAAVRRTIAQAVLPRTDASGPPSPITAEFDTQSFMGPDQMRPVAEQPVLSKPEVAAAAPAAAAAQRVNKARKPDSMPPNVCTDSVPNLWLAVGHMSSLKGKKVLKVTVDGKPIAIWRTSTGELKAISDICIHRGASLAKGWLHQDRLVCPYHGFEFDGHGTLQYMPGVTKEGVTKQGCSGSGRKTQAYLVREKNGWIYLFPDAARPGAIEQYSEPFTIAEASDPRFRYVEGSVEIGGDAAACMENMLDLLHISYVHSFGNLNSPVPFEVDYNHSYDDANGALASTSVTFRYKSGPKSFSKVVGKSPEVVVRNEYHLPYHAVIRVFFGEDCIKTIHAAAVPSEEGKTTLHWKLYRNFFMTHPMDQGPLNAAADLLFRQMMRVTLQEDKDIIEAIYPGYQRGYMNAKFDKQVLFWRKAYDRFQEVSAARSSTQLESALQMELLARIAGTRRGNAQSTSDRRAILRLIEQLETVSPPAAATSAAAADAAPAAADAAAVVATAVPQVPAAAAAAAAAAVTEAAAAEVAAESVGGEWHLQYMAEPKGGGDAGANSDPEVSAEVADAVLSAVDGQVLQQAGGEAYLLDWNQNGRPLWADTEESVQIIDTDSQIISNRASYRGWSGLRTTVQLDAIFKACEENANRLLIEFRRAAVDIGGLKLSFPHLSRFSPRGWLETTYVNDHLRIARGNKG